MKSRLMVSCFLLALGATACGGVQAMRTAEGGPVKVYTLVDPNLKATLTPEKATLRADVVKEMVPQLGELLTDRGIEAVAITSRDQFRPGPGSYLLVLTITAVNPGSLADRFMVGLGLGNAALSLHQDLFQDPAQPALLADDLVSSGSIMAPPMVAGDWRACVYDLNRVVTRSVTDRLGKHAGG